MKSFSLMIIGLIALSTQALHAASDGTELNFLSQLSPLQNVQYISTPEQNHQPLADAFDQAKTSIYVGIFGISDPLVADGLVAAQKRGVHVVVLCDKYCSDGPGRLKVVNQLKDAGVEFYTTSSGFSISHWKMFIVDEKKAFISTMNFIKATAQMRDMGLFFTNPEMIAEMVSVFNADVQNAKNETALTPPLTNPNLVWSPVNSESKLTTLIGSAQTSIDIWVENVGDQTIHDALKAAVQRGVKVRLLTSECGMGMQPAASFVHLKDLASGGVNVHVMAYPANSTMPYIHAKTIDVDHHTVFLGSENFSMNSLLKSRELGLIFQNNDVEAKMNGLYEGDWSESNALPDVAPSRCNPL